jgi:hypothetical protein
MIASIPELHRLLTCRALRRQYFRESEMKRTKPHEHRAVTVHALRQRAGIPYEVERKVCAACARVLDERPLRRAAT